MPVKAGGMVAILCGGGYLIGWSVRELGGPWWVGLLIGATGGLVVSRIVNSLIDDDFRRTDR